MCLLFVNTSREYSVSTHKTNNTSNDTTNTKNTSSITRTEQLDEGLMCSCSVVYLHISRQHHSETVKYHVTAVLVVGCGGLRP